MNQINKNLKNKCIAYCLELSFNYVNIERITLITILLLLKQLVQKICFDQKA